MQDKFSPKMQDIQADITRKKINPKNVNIFGYIKKKFLKIFGLPKKG